MEIQKLTKEQEFRNLKVGDELLVSWNPEGEMWSKEMEGNKLYRILRIQKANNRSLYPDEIILRKRENIFFNFRFFLNGESKIVKQVYLLLEKEVRNSSQSFRIGYPCDDYMKNKIHNPKGYYITERR